MYEPFTALRRISQAEYRQSDRTILAAGMMLKYAFDMDQEAAEIEEAVEAALRLGYRTKISWRMEKHTGHVPRWEIRLRN